MVSGRRGRFSEEAWLEGSGENGGEGEEESEKEYLRRPGAKLTGRGEGGVGGDDVGES